jgi:hypothetical protein
VRTKTGPVEEAEKSDEVGQRNEWVERVWIEMLLAGEETEDKNSLDRGRLHDKPWGKGERAD